MKWTERIDKYHKWQYRKYLNSSISRECRTGKSRKLLYGMAYKLHGDRRRKSLYLCMQEWWVIRVISDYLKLSNVESGFHRLAKRLQDWKTAEQRYDSKERDASDIFCYWWAARIKNSVLIRATCRNQWQRLAKNMLIGRAATHHIIIRRRTKTNQDSRSCRHCRL